jgi:hypothetical protein
MRIAAIIFAAGAVRETAADERRADRQQFPDVVDLEPEFARMPDELSRRTASGS